MSATTPSLNVLEYQPPPAPTEFDLELASERARWLRRRFIWFCAVNIAIQIFLFAYFAKDIGRSPALSKVLNIVKPVAFVGCYLLASFYVARSKPPLNRMVRLALLITSVLPSISLLLFRADFSLDPTGWG